MLTIIFEPIRNYLWGPKIILEFDPDENAHEKGFATKTQERVPPGKMRDASYIRVLSTNKGKSIAKQCRAYLVNFEEWNPTLNRFENTIYCEALQLKWSASDKSLEPIDIPRDVIKFIDLLSVNRESPYPEIHAEIKLYRYEPLFNKGEGKFRYTVLITGENFKPKSIKVGFEWNGKWDQYKVFRG